jgi:hypothetical protein
VFEFTYTRSVVALNAGAAFTVEWSDTLPGTSWSTTGVTEQHPLRQRHGAAGEGAGARGQCWADALRI